MGERGSKGGGTTEEKEYAARSGPLAAVVGEDVGCHGRGPAETEKAGEEGWVRADAAASADARRSCAAAAVGQ